MGHEGVHRSDLVSHIITISVENAIEKLRKQEKDDTKGRNNNMGLEGMNCTLFDSTRVRLLKSSGPCGRLQNFLSCIFQSGELRQIPSTYHKFQVLRWLESMCQ